MKLPRNLMKKVLVAWICASTGLSPLTAPLASAASTDYTDVPLPSKRRPNPNIIFAIDDSGSMDGEISINGNDGALWYNRQDGAFFGRDLNNKLVWSNGGGSTGTMDKFVDATVVGSNPFNGTFNFNAEGTAGIDSSNLIWKKYIYLFPNGQCGTNCATRSYGDTDHDHFAIPPTPQYAYLRSPVYNKQFYNPNINYDPWRPYNDGTSTCPSGTGSGSGVNYLCTPADATATKAMSHPMYSGPTFDLTQTVAAPDPQTNASDSKVQNWTFRVYPGMILPAGAWYTQCAGTGYCNNKYTQATQDTCVIGIVAGQNVSTCVRAGMTFATTMDLSNKWNHLEAQIAYDPSIYYRLATSAETPDAYGPDGRPLKMVDIKATGVNYVLPGALARTDCALTYVNNTDGTVNVAASYATCTPANEIQNYANWFQYYRKRSLSLNAAFGNAIDGVRALRGGYFLFNNRFNVNIYDFDNTTDFTKNQRGLLGAIFRTKGDGGTPTRDTLNWMGQQYQRTDSGAPIQAKCVFNGGFVITDGFASPGGPSFGNVDANTPGTIQPKSAATSPPGNPTPTGYVNYWNQQNGSTTPTGIIKPYKDGWSDTLADIAMYYYANNLRPDLPTGFVPIATNDASPDADLNPNLHMNTFGLILGLRGLIFGVDATKTNDPYNNPPDWDALYSGTSAPTALARNPRAIDELWHATINGRGDMLAADSPEETRNAVLSVVNKVQNKGGAAAAVSVSNANPVKGDNFSYSTAYNAGSWYGDLSKQIIDVDPSSPTYGQVIGNNLWTPTPRQQIADRDWTKRLVATYRRDTAVGVPFQSASLNAAQLTSLSPPASGGPLKGTVDQKIFYIRGDRSNEQTLFRSRGATKFLDPITGVYRWGTADGLPPDGVAVLGDMVNAEPLIVGKPNFSYADNGYGAYKDTYSTRTPVLFQAANDGMLHAFSTVDGSELWAYIPSYAFDARQDGTPGLASLTDRDTYIHKFFVDASPVSADIDFDKAGNPSGASGTPSWRTMVVGGLGKGGRGWFALDVTSSAATSDAEVASKVMWEFPNAKDNTHTAGNLYKNVGYSYGRPIVVKTKAAGWVVLVTSGYENGNETGGDGRGHLFVLNAKTGAVIKDLQTVDAQDGYGSGGASARQANPLGLAFVSAYVDNSDVDNTVQYVYGGDLYGNLWRFDLSGSSTSSWGTTLITTFTDSTGARQQITTEPELGVVGATRVVFVGTGRYYGDNDIPQTPSPPRFPSATQVQSFYAVQDDLTGTPFSPAVNPRSQLVQRTITKDTVNGTATITGATFTFGSTAGKKGWYVDLQDPANKTADVGERVITNPTLGLGVITFTSNVPNGADPCIPGGSSWIYQLDYKTGVVVPGASGTAISRISTQALASRVVLIRLPDGSVRGLTRRSDQVTVSTPIPIPTSAVAGKRKSWRELILSQ